MDNSNPFETKCRCTPGFSGTFCEAATTTKTATKTTTTKTTTTTTTATTISNVGDETNKATDDQKYPSIYSRVDDYNNLHFIREKAFNDSIIKPDGINGMYQTVGYE